MIELLFSDSAGGALTVVKRCGNERPRKGKSIKTTIDQDGNETFEEIEIDIQPYEGPTIDGSPSDILSLWLLADVGDISDMTAFAGRPPVWRDIFNMHKYEEGAAQAGEMTEPMVAAAQRLKDAAENGEPVRIWWSDTPGDACGYYWAMTLLKDAAGPVTEVKAPPFLEEAQGGRRCLGLGELLPEHFPLLLQHERTVARAERHAIAAEWEKLAAENAPLRAVVNGQLRSVPADFYDGVLRRSMPDEECTVATLIGRSITDGPPGVSDWWYACRIRFMLDTGELELVREKKRFYVCVIRKRGQAGIDNS